MSFSCHRRLVCTLTSLVLVLAQGGCGGSPGKQVSGGTPKIGFVLATLKLSFAAAMADGFRTGVEQVGGVDLEVVAPDIVDNAQQLRMFNDLTKTAKSGISIYTLSPEVFNQPMADAVKSHIPIIAVDNPPPPSSGVKLFIGNDNYELGKLLAQQVIAKLPPNATGKIVLGSNAPGAVVLDRRARGMRDEIKATLPNVKVLGPFDTKQEVAANLAAWDTLTTVNNDALAFLGTGDADGWNLAETRKRKKARWVAGAFDLDPKSLAAVKAGNLVLVSPEHFVKGEVAGRLQAQHAKDGEPLPQGWLYIPGLAVNSSNIDAVAARQASIKTTAAAVATQVDTILHDVSYLRSMTAVS
jgi:ribose transport system substrate-binding protein